MGRHDAAVKRLTAATTATACASPASQRLCEMPGHTDTPHTQLLLVRHATS